MLADTPLPRGSGATLAGVGTLSEGFERSVASPLLPRRLRAMGRTVWSILLCQTILPTAFRSQAADKAASLERWKSFCRQLP